MNCVSELEYVFDFVNKSSDPVECKYRFPTENHMFITGCRFNLNGEEIIMKIKPKDSIEEIYED